MIHAIAKVDAAEFAAAYGLDSDEPRLAYVIESMQSLHPMFRSQRRCADQQAWLDEFARIVHETTQRHQGDPVVWTCDADEFAQWASVQ